MHDTRIPEFGPMFQVMTDYERAYRRAVVEPAAARRAAQEREQALARSQEIGPAISRRATVTRWLGVRLVRAGERLLSEPAASAA